MAERIDPLRNFRFQLVIDSIKQAGLEADIASGALPLNLRHPVGCPVCRQTGFRGRTTVSEFLIVGAAVQDRLLTDGTERAIQDAAESSGMTSMFRDGVSKVLAG